MDMSRGGRQGADVGAEQKYLAFAHDHIRLLQLYAPIPNGFDLPSFKHDSRFETVFNKVIMGSFFIVNNGHEMRKKNRSVKLESSVASHA